MIIRELTHQEGRDLLSRVTLGRLACVRENRPYILPLSFAYHNDSLFSASTAGRKIEWMRENPMVAVEFDEITNAQNWKSVIVSGRYEEFSDTPELRDHRQRAWSVLQKRKLWWEPAYVKTLLGGAERPLTPIYFCVHIEEVTGHYATDE